VAHAQQAALPLSGFVNSTSRQTYEPQLAVFLKGLGEAGYFERGNVAIEYRSTCTVAETVIGHFGSFRKLHIKAAQAVCA
jgi:hypothetical protein